MPLTLAQANAWSLATTLMVCVVLFQAEGGFRSFSAGRAAGLRPGLVFPSEGS